MNTWFNSHAARWTVALVYSAGLLAYLLQPPGAPSVEVIAPVAAPLWQREVAFTVGHIIGFGVLYVLWWRVLVGASPGRRGVGALLIVTAIGLTAELLQSHLPERSASVYDMAANTLGAGLAYAVLWWRRR